MLDFVAIDFETANSYPSSVCSVGAVVVRGGAVVERFYRLVRPEPEWYAGWNTRVHGLTMADTMDAPVFPQVWEELAERIGGLPLVAHNSAFDERCLRAVHRVYRMDYPEYAFFCTCRASRRVFGGLLPNHQLQTTAAHCGFDLRQHHHALADAEACAAIAMRVFGEGSEYQ
jgi:DNA polymerase-3 subunit epsilon